MAKFTVPADDFDQEVVTASTKAFMTASGAKGSADGLMLVPPDAVHEIEGFNVRIDTPDYLDHLGGIKASMRANGYYRNKPITGYIGKLEDGTLKLFLTDGYTRNRAVRELIAEGVEIEAIPTIVKPAGQSLEDMMVALVQDNEGRPLSPFERAIVVQRMTNLNVEKARIAERLDITTRYVDDLLILAGAPAKVRNLVVTGKVSATEAIKQLRKDVKSAATKLEAGVKAAAEAGKEKATGKDVKKAAPEAEIEIKSGVESSSKVRGGLVKTELEFTFKAGDTVPYDQVKPVRFFNDGDWWNFVDENTKEHAFIEETIHIAVTITTKAPNEETPAPAADDDATFDDGTATAETPAEDEI